VSALVVDSSAGKIYSSTSAADVSTAVEDMVTRLVGYPPADPHHADAVKALQDHYAAVLAVNASGSARNTTTTALRSTFALACQSPTALSFGL
jgi:hypothetical protein